MEFFPVWLLSAAATWVLWLTVRTLLRRDDHPTLERLEWISPLKGRWLRYALLFVTLPLFALVLIITLLGGVMGACLLVMSTR